MDFLNKCIAHHFKTQDGKSVFFPWSSLGKGYILPDKAKKEAVAQFLKIFYVVAVIAIIISILTGLTLLIPVVVVAAIWFWAHTNMLTKGLATTEDKKGTKKPDAKSDTKPE